MVPTTSACGIPDGCRLRIPARESGMLHQKRLAHPVGAPRSQAGEGLAVRPGHHRYAEDRTRRVDAERVLNNARIAERDQPTTPNSVDVGNRLPQTARCAGRNLHPQPVARNPRPPCDERTLLLWCQRARPGARDIRPAAWRRWRRISVGRPSSSDQATESDADEDRNRRDRPPHGNSFLCATAQQ